MATRANLAELLDDVELDVGKATASGRSGFVRGSAEYAFGTVAVIHLGVLTEKENKEKYAEFLDALSADEKEAMRVTRNIAAHAGYAKMRDDAFWSALDEHIPTIIEKLRSRL